MSEQLLLKKLTLHILLLAIVVINKLQKESKNTDEINVLIKFVSDEFVEEGTPLHAKSCIKLTNARILGHFVCTMKAELGQGQPGLMRWNFCETCPRTVLIPGPLT